MGIEFRFAVPEDLPNIVATYNASIPSRQVTADLEEVSVSSKKAWFDAHDQQKRPIWVVLNNDEYIGWMSFNSFYGRPAYDATVELSIYLNPDFQSKGIGKICLQKAIDEAQHFKVNTLLGFIFGHNEVSIKLFASFGFKIWAHLPQVANMDGNLRDLLILGRKT